VTRRAAMLALMLASLASGCAPLATKEARASKSSVGCMEAAIAGRGLETLPDSQAHCIAAGLIARHCSLSEAAMASVGKEVRDLFGGGDAEWRDLVSDRRGIGCARHTGTDAQLQDCCQNPP
jgi:hypothetical protein